MRTVASFVCGVEWEPVEDALQDDLATKRSSHDGLGLFCGMEKDV